MPRVSTRTRKRKEVKRAMKCAAYPCTLAEQRDGSSEIMVGDTYYTWARKMGRSGVVYFQHQACGYPKRSQLSSRKTVAIEDAIDAAQTTISQWTPDLEASGDVEGEITYAFTGGIEDITTALEEVASVARDVGQEYQDGFDNMPEGLNQGETAMAMEEVAQELDSYADNLESWSPSSEEPDLPDRDVDEDDDVYRQRCEEALDDWASELRSDAEDAMSDMPEYQG